MVDKEMLKFLYKLKQVDRYATKPRIQKETVAEHSYYVALFSMMLCDELGIFGNERNKVLQTALVHDLPEMITSDIPYPSIIALKKCGVSFNGVDTEVIKSILPHYSNEMNDYEEQETVEALIVKMADILQCFQYCYNEESMGNTNMQDALESAQKRYQEVKLKLKSDFGLEPELFDGE